MAVPTIEPHLRNPAEVAPTDSYRPGVPVWVYRGGAWCAGFIEACSARAAMVTYRPSGSRGTGVDTIFARDIVARADSDPLLDSALG
ncbi:hypothetical protein Val02_70290 [Virgisporangium aliadipatigenens]|uniref:Uncharacterized protein n=1 Tax=Virgisporangium aliadipatigenens TaxID=741659 RepID=A0A8J4DUK3_9ACTN|nr:hypothetical protein [Virgisporangium aliadipatigenens]GIJ50143.1 hypothetical protein Val02_70290 [Virgisporangium aliadipatigenens]